MMLNAFARVVVSINRLLIPDSAHCQNTGEIRRTERLGGMLNYYYRDAA
jgi:hypothetical protein